MPRLPDANALGGPAQINPSRPIATIDGSALGRGIAGLGASIGEIADRQQKQQTAMERAQADFALSQATLDMDKYARDARLAAPPGAKGYAETVANGFDAYAANVLGKQQGVAAQKELQLGLSQLRTRMVIGARDEEEKATAQYWVDTLKAAGENVGRIAFQDPGRFTEALAPHLATIQSIADLPPEQKAKLQRTIIEDTAKAAGYGYIERGGLAHLFRSVPASAWLSMSEPDSTVPPPIDTPTQRLIQGAAANSGIDPAYMLATADIESGFNPTAQNPKSSAGGLFQFTDGTWRQYGGDAPKSDAVANTLAAVGLTRDNERALANVLGRQPLPWELYIAHQQGAGGAAALLRADPRSKVVDALRSAGVANAERAAADNGMSDMSVGGALAMWKSKFSDAYKKYGGAPGQDKYQPAPPQEMPTWWNLMSWSDQRQILAAAVSKQESALRTANTQEERLERAARLQEQQIQRATAMEGDRLFSDAALTPEWIEANRGTLSAGDYRYFRGKLEDVPERTDPQVFNEISGMLAQGKDIRDAARGALQQGALSRASYDRLISVAEKAGVVPQGAPSPYQQGANAISVALKPPEFVSDPDASNRAYRAHAEFQEWFDKNPGATAEAARTEAAQIINSYQFVKINDFVTTAPLPRFTVGGDRFSGFDVEQTRNATVKAFLDRHGGDRTAALADPEYRKQTQLIERWQDALQQRAAQQQRTSEEKKNGRR